MLCVALFLFIKTDCMNETARGHLEKEIAELQFEANSLMVAFNAVPSTMVLLRNSIQLECEAVVSLRNQLQKMLDEAVAKELGNQDHPQ